MATLVARFQLPNMILSHCDFYLAVLSAPSSPLSFGGILCWPTLCTPSPPICGRPTAVGRQAISLFWLHSIYLLYFYYFIRFTKRKTGISISGRCIEFLEPDSLWYDLFSLVFVLFCFLLLPPLSFINQTAWKNWKISLLEKNANRVDSQLRFSNYLSPSWRSVYFYLFPLYSNHW